MSLDQSQVHSGVWSLRLAMAGVTLLRRGHSGTVKDFLIQSYLAVEERFVDWRSLVENVIPVRPDGPDSLSNKYPNDNLETIGDLLGYEFNSDKWAVQAVPGLQGKYPEVKGSNEKLSAIGAHFLCYSRSLVIGERKEVPLVRRTHLQAVALYIGIAFPPYLTECTLLTCSVMMEALIGAILVDSGDVGNTHLRTNRLLASVPPVVEAYKPGVVVGDMKFKSASSDAYPHIQEMLGYNFTDLGWAYNALASRQYRLLHGDGQPRMQDTLAHVGQQVLKFALAEYLSYRFNFESVDSRVNSAVSTICLEAPVFLEVDRLQLVAPGEYEHLIRRSRIYATNTVLSLLGAVWQDSDKNFRVFKKVVIRLLKNMKCISHLQEDREQYVRRAAERVKNKGSRILSLD